MNNHMILQPKIQFGPIISKRITSSIIKGYYQDKNISEDVYIKVIKKKFVTEDMIQKQSQIVSLLTKFDIVNLIYEYDDSSNYYFVFRYGPFHIAFDIISDDCTISEKNGIGILYYLLNNINIQCKTFAKMLETNLKTQIFHNHFKSLINLEMEVTAKLLILLLNGQFQLFDLSSDSFQIHLNNVSNELKLILNDILSNPIDKRPSPENCLQSYLFQSPKAQFAIQDFQKKCYKENFQGNDLFLSNMLMLSKTNFREDIFYRIFENSQF